MQKILNIIEKSGGTVTLFLILIIFLKTCNTNSKIEKLEKVIFINSQKQDSLYYQLKNEIKIEGLKSEKRMIQSTDRKILDVNRQTEIDKEINVLEK